MQFVNPPEDHAAIGVARILQHFQLQDLEQQGVGVFDGRVQQDGLVEVLQGLLVPHHPVVRLAQQVVITSALGIDPDQVLIGSDGFVHLALCVEEITDVLVRAVVVRVEIGGADEFGHRLAGFAFLEICLRELVVESGLVGELPDGLFKLLDGLFIVAGGKRRIPFGFMLAGGRDKRNSQCQQGCEEQDPDGDRHPAVHGTSWSPLSFSWARAYQGLAGVTVRLTFSQYWRAPARSPC